MAWPKYFPKAMYIRIAEGLEMTDRTLEGNTLLMRSQLGPVVGLMSLLFEVANQAIAHSKVFYTPLNSIKSHKPGRDVKKPTSCLL